MRDRNDVRRIRQCALCVSTHLVCIQMRARRSTGLRRSNACAVAAINARSISAPRMAL
jgi:hypothetical protein